MRTLCNTRDSSGKTRWKYQENRGIPRDTIKDHIAYSFSVVNTTVCRGRGEFFGIEGGRNTAPLLFDVMCTYSRRQNTVLQCTENPPAFPLCPWDPTVGKQGKLQGNPGIIRYHGTLLLGSEIEMECSVTVLGSFSLVFCTPSIACINIKSSGG